MKKNLLLVLLLLSLGSCVTISCPAYQGSSKPLRKPTFLKDDGRQGNKYSAAAQQAAEATDKELYLSILKLTPKK